MTLLETFAKTGQKLSVIVLTFMPFFITWILVGQLIQSKLTVDRLTKVIGIIDRTKEVITIVSKVRYVASDEHTANKAAAILGAAIGKPDLRWVTFTNEQMQEGLEKNGIPAPIATLFVELGDSLHTRVLLQDYEIHKPNNLGNIKLEDFAKEFATAFLKEWLPLSYKKWQAYFLFY